MAAPRERRTTAAHDHRSRSAARDRRAVRGTASSAAAAAAATSRDADRAAGDRRRPAHGGAGHDDHDRAGEPTLPNGSSTSSRPATRSSPRSRSRPASTDDRPPPTDDDADRHRRRVADGRRRPPPPPSAEPVGRHDRRGDRRVRPGRVTTARVQVGSTQYTVAAGQVVRHQLQGRVALRHLRPVPVRRLAVQPLRGRAGHQVRAGRRSGAGRSPGTLGRPCCAT